MQRIRFTALFVCTFAASSSASVIEYKNNRSSWLAAVGTYTQITFQGFDDNTIITDQYANLEIHFTDGTDRIFVNETAFPNDGVGLYGAIDEIHLGFAAPTYSIAADFPGLLQYKLYWQGALIYVSTPHVTGIVGSFFGLISTRPFDAAVILDPAGNVNIDDLYFGPSVPAPAGIVVLAAGLMSRASRRRRTQPKSSVNRQMGNGFPSARE